MTLQEHNELLACLTFFLKHASDEHLYFGGYSSQKAWDAFAKLMYNVTGEELSSALNTKE